jgi:hypothetical protein
MTTHTTLPARFLGGSPHPWLHCSDAPLRSDRPRDEPRNSRHVRI